MATGQGAKFEMFYWTKIFIFKIKVISVMYMKNMQIIANNIAILWENRFATEDLIIYFVTIEPNKPNIELLYTNKKLPVAPVKLTLYKKIRLRLNSTILGAVYMRGGDGTFAGTGRFIHPGFGAVYMIPLCRDEMWGGMILTYWNKSRCTI
jgi:hypothetical protein